MSLIRPILLTGLLCLALTEAGWRLVGIGVAAAEPSPSPTSQSALGEALPPVAKLLEIYDCARCHRLHTPHRLIGPSLWKLGERRDVAAIRASLVSPDAVVTPGFAAGLMKQRLEQVGFYTDIQRQPEILDRIVAYLAGRPEAPAVESKVDGFTIDPAPVSKMAFAKFMADGGYTTKRYWNRNGWMVLIRRRHRTEPLGWQAERDAVSNQPAVGVTWYEADAYCRWSGKSLPSEQQWERACRTMPTWSDAVSGTGLRWEWTQEAVWKGGEEMIGDRTSRCFAKVPSYPALDGRHTGFRCGGRATASQGMQK